jgi:hypothetical protein
MVIVFFPFRTADGHERTHTVQIAPRERGSVLAEARALCPRFVLDNQIAPAWTVPYSVYWGIPNWRM